MVYDVADIPLVDGPADGGRTVTVELDEDRTPPSRLELDDGVYELEPIAGGTGALALPMAARHLSARDG